MIYLQEEFLQLAAKIVVGFIIYQALSIEIIICQALNIKITKILTVLTLLMG